jgi:hypothetical protein
MLRPLGSNIEFGHEERTGFYPILLRELRGLKKG